MLLTGIASIMKNYCTHESSKINMILHLENLTKLKDIGLYQPCDKSTIFETTQFLQSIHVDYENDKPCLYDVPSCPIIELRGNSKQLHLKKDDVNMLLDYVISDCTENTLLHSLSVSYQNYVRKFPLRYKKKILEFIAFKIKEKTEINKWRSELKCIIQLKEFDSDLKYLIRIANKDSYKIE